MASLRTGNGAETRRWGSEPAGCMGGAVQAEAQLVRGPGWGSESGLFKAEQGQSSWVAVVAERAGEDKAKEVRRLAVQSHCNDLGFSEMGSAMWGLGAEASHDRICGLQDAPPGCIENRLQEKQVKKQEICQEVMAATQAGDNNSLDHDDRDGGKET